MSSPRVDSTVPLPDGRNLAYAEYAEIVGAPVFVLHGLPGSRLVWGSLSGDPFPSGLRVVAPDRPGYGRSDANPGRTLLDWADDLIALADALEIKRFAVVGVSGGGPGALACAWKFPQRIASVTVVSSPAPTDAPGVFRGMSRTNKIFMKLAWRVPCVSDLNTRLIGAVIRGNPARYIDVMQRKVHEVDRTLLAQSGISSVLADDFAEALRAGAQGMVDDMASNHGRPWGFPLAEIPVPVHVWSCERDQSVPPAMARHLIGEIPGCTSTFVANAGHLWVLTNLREVLLEVAAGLCARTVESESTDECRSTAGLE